MANKNLFSTQKASKVVSPADTINEAGGKAYKREARAALAQYALTGTFNNTFYVTGETQVEQLIKLSTQVEPFFIAKLAIYAREHGFMKDMPAALLAILTAQKSPFLGYAFKRVLDSPRMLRTYVQMVRAGTFGRKSFGSYPRRLIQRWLQDKTPSELFYASVGNDPSLLDIINMAHPALNPGQQLVVSYLKGKLKDGFTELPEVIQEFEAYKRNPTDEPPRVPFEMLTGLPLTDGAWATIAGNASWTQTRMNLNTFQRHNVLNDEQAVKVLYSRLVDEKLIERAKVMPYQLFNSWLATKGQIPSLLSVGLQQAAEISLANVLSYDGEVLIAIDTSGSMSSPITGNRGSATTSMQCVQVASLIGAAIKRKNPSAVIAAFDTKYHEIPDKQVVGKTTLEFAAELAKYGGGGTSCEIPLARWNAESKRANLVIYVSDNESWFDHKGYTVYGRSASTATSMSREWAEYKRRNPEAKLVCIDLSPSSSTQVPSRADSLNIGGFSDQVFEIIRMFSRGEFAGETLVSAIELM